MSKDYVINCLRRDVKELSKQVQQKEEIIELLLGYFRYETGLRSLDSYLKTTLDDSLDSTGKYIEVMDRFI